MSAPLALQWSDWANLFAHYLWLSLLSVGGAISTAPDMHRFLVGEQRWISDSQFNASIAIGQAAPGPNVLFVALLGWHVGLNTGNMWWAPFGALVTMLGVLLPSSTLSYATARWVHRNRELRAVRAFKQGMAPIVVALLIATGWVLDSGYADTPTRWQLWSLAFVCALIVWRTRIHLLWLLAAGALAGWFGLV